MNNSIEVCIQIVCVSTQAEACVANDITRPCEPLLHLWIWRASLGKLHMALLKPWLNYFGEFPSPELKFFQVYFLWTFRVRPSPQERRRLHSCLLRMCFFWADFGWGVCFQKADFGWGAERCCKSLHEARVPHRVIFFRVENLTGDNMDPNWKLQKGGWKNQILGGEKS